jgi:hypothetical protein
VESFRRITGHGLAEFDRKGKDEAQGFRFRSDFGKVA